MAIVVGLVAAGAATGSVLLAARDQLRRDGVALVTLDRPPTRDQLTFGLGLAALVANADSRLVSLGRQRLPWWIDGFKSWGTSKMANVIGASLVTGGLIHGDRRTLIGGLTLLEGNVIVGVVVDASKEVFGRVRPNHPGAGAWFARGDSFPSSHAAHAFLIASVLDATLEEPEWRWFVSVAASGVALQRIHEGVHYPTDVLAGGALGWWIGHRLSLSHGLDDRPHQVPVSWVPRPDSGRVVARTLF